MPTGYTSSIKDGISLNDFIMSCAKAFGACISMRDEAHDKPIPDAFEPSPYHLEQQIQEKAKLHGMKRLSKEDAENHAEMEYMDKVASIKKGIKENKDLRKQYEEMLAKVKSWKSPSEEHDELKTFMIDQITKSIRFDCGSYYEDMDAPVKLSGKTWQDKAIASLEESIAYHTRNYAEECTRQKGRSEWVSRLRKSLSQNV